MTPALSIKNDYILNVSARVKRAGEAAFGPEIPLAGNTMWFRARVRWDQALRSLRGERGGVVYTTVGRAYVVDVIDATISNQSSFTHYIEHGTGETEAAVGATAVESAVDAREAATKGQPNASTNRWVATITNGGTQTIRVAGVLTAAEGGTLVLYASFTGKPFVANDQIQYTFTLQQAV